MILTMGFTRIADAFGDSGSISVSLYAIACCVMALAVQLILFHEIDLQYENDTIRLLWQEDQRQYELTKKTIDTINIKHHDLKHRLAEMNAMLSKDDIRSIEEAVNVYDSKIKTGNEALDVLLTKNSLVCKEEGISLTYTGNGADFSFMSTMDVYSLFGNAVDNAIEAVRKVEDPEKKIVDIVTERTGAMITVVVTNYFPISFNSLTACLPPPKGRGGLSWVRHEEYENSIGKVSWFRACPHGGRRVRTHDLYFDVR